MPTPLSSVQQCLTPESLKVLDDAVAVARRRNHAQTTSLHVVSALLVLPSSGFRDACVRSRFVYSSNRLHSRALELSFGVALDRLPSSHCDDPPISNSLMAAIKRAQAIQRRFSADVAAATAAADAVQTHQQPLSSVKVEMQQLVLSILDDPIVSRVMADAGFRSNDVKLAIERPLPPPRFFPRPPLFLCSMPEFGSTATGDGFGRCSGKLADVLLAQKKTNPLLLSMVNGAGDGLVREFVTSIEKGGVSEGIDGTMVVNLEKELMVRDTESLKTKAEEVQKMVEGCTGPGVMLNLGDLKSLVDGVSLGLSSFVVLVVSEISRLVGARRSSGKRLWLIATSTYEIFMQLQTCYPSMEDDWDLYPLPISSLRSPPRLFPKSSLMESFVPFGGLFATAAELKAPYASTYEPAIYEPQSEKNEAVNCDKVSLPRTETNILPSWLQRVNTEHPVVASGSALAKDDNAVLNAQPEALTKKPANAHQQIQNNSLLGKSDTCRSASCLDFGSLHGVGRKEMATTRSHNTDTGTQNPTLWLNFQHEKVPKENVFLPVPSVNPEPEENQQPKLHKSYRNIDQLPQSCLYGSQTALLHDSPPSSKIPVTTELALGTPFALQREEERAPVTPKGHHNGLWSGMATKPHEIGRFPPHAAHASNSGVADITARGVAKVPWCSSAIIPSTSFDGELPAGHSIGFTNLRGRQASEFDSQFDPSYYKKLRSDLLGMVGRQTGAIEAVCRTIVNCRVGKEQCRRGASLKGDIWLCFLGQDHVGKKKVASALADTLFGGAKNFISINLDFQGDEADSNSIFDRPEIDGYDTRFRGKTTVDYITEEIRKKPSSIIFLENTDKADDLVRSSLLHAIRTGKFSDSRGRETRIKNSIVVMTGRSTKGNECASDSMGTGFSEESILKAKAWEMQFLIEISHKDHLCSKQEAPGLFSKRRWNDEGQWVCAKSLEMAKRLHGSPSMPFDLNVALEELGEEIIPVDCSHSSNGTASDGGEAWMDDFEDLLDNTVEFEPFNFDNLADEVSKKMVGRLHSILGRQAVLEIDHRAMDQILGAVWLSDRKGAFDDWVEHVLSRGLLQVRQKHGTGTTMVLKLVACQNQSLEEKAPGIYLPTKIRIY